MAKTITIPGDLFADSECPPTTGITAIRLYDSTQPSVKSRVTVRKNLFSFVLEGEKIAYLPGNPVRIGAGHFLLISGGNCLMTEKLSTQGRYRSLLFFFDDELLTNFYFKYPALSGQASYNGEPIVRFERDAFVTNFLHSLELMLQHTPTLQDELQQLKLEELLLYLAGQYPQLHSIRRTLAADTLDEQLKAAVEGNLNHAIAVEELAFLCNMSLSTFNRRFARLYGTTPNKWLLQRRMEQAAALLTGREKPSDIYLKVGYENHSSFSQSFKQVYGMTPREYQRLRLNVLL